MQTYNKRETDTLMDGMVDGNLALESSAKIEAGAANDNNGSAQPFVQTIAGKTRLDRNEVLRRNNSYWPLRRA